MYTNGRTYARRFHTAYRTVLVDLHRRQLIRSSQLTHAVTADRRPLTTSRLQTACRRRGSDLVDETSLGDKIQASSYSGDRRARHAARHAARRLSCVICRRGAGQWQGARAAAASMSFNFRAHVLMFSYFLYAAKNRPMQCVRNRRVRWTARNTYCLNWVSILAQDVFFCRLLTVN